MENSRRVEEAFDTGPGWTRIIGGPKLKWDDGMIQHVMTVGVKVWRTLARNREDWLKKDRVHTELSSR
jgi:hypothetical protein